MKEDKRIKYIDIKNQTSSEPQRKQADKSRSPVKKRPVPGHLTPQQKVGHVLGVIGTTFLTIFLIFIITICIVAVALTVYVMQFAENSFDIDLKDVELSYTSSIVAYDKDNNEVELKQLSSDQNRVWVDIEDMPMHLVDAIVATEDERYFEHDGVDWTRTVTVTFKAFFMSGTEGGSTITQQLVRDVTKDNKTNAGRKLREIFRALSLEQKYTKFDILESYLNRIGFGGTCYGVGSAAKYYFDKEVRDLTVAECAILTGLVRSPSNFNPYASPENARIRQKYTLDKMFELGMLSTLEYEDAMDEQVRFRRPVSGSFWGYIDERYNDYYGIQETSPEEEDLYYENEDWSDILQNVAYKWNGDYKVTQSWYVDAAIKQVVADLAELKGVSETSARDMLLSGGYKVYLNVDLELQDKMTELFENPLLCVKSFDPAASKADLLQAAFVLMDYRGNVLAIAGGLGEKEGDNCYNRASQSTRAIGSTIKPISVYSIALDLNLITYSTMIRDISGEYTPDPNKPDEKERWPYNYQETTPGSGQYWPAWYAVQKSLNTIAIRTLSMIGIQTSYLRLTDRLGFTTLDSTNDMSWSPMAFGALTNGAKLDELAAAYQIFGNGGVYYEPYYYSKVVDSFGKTVLEQNYTGIQAIGSDSAWITNRMMKKVVEDQWGSGINAVLPNVEVIGKTGTTNDESNLLFCGLTPDYVGVYRIGYDDHKPIERANAGGTWRTLALVWHDVMMGLIDTETERSFTPDNGVVAIEYCNETGLLATSRCPNKTIGYYKQSFLPESCDDLTHDGTYWKTHGDPEDYIPFYKT